LQYVSANSDAVKQISMSIKTKSWC